MDMIIITDMTYDEMRELAYDRAAEAYDGPELSYMDDEHFDERVDDEMDNIIDEEVHEIYDADDLKRWFLHHGWTLDRGYGGPNYKERLAEEKNWDLIFDLMLYSGKEKDYMFDVPIYTPTEANDMILFAEDDLEDDYEDDYEEAHNGPRSIQELTFEEVEQLFNEIVFNSVYTADYENTLGINPAEVSNYADGYLDELMTDDEGKYLGDKAFEDIQLTAEGFYDYIQSVEA